MSNRSIPDHILDDGGVKDSGGFGDTWKTFLALTTNDVSGGGDLARRSLLLLGKGKKNNRFA